MRSGSERMISARTTLLHSSRLSCRVHAVTRPSIGHCQDHPGKAQEHDNNLRFPRPPSSPDTHRRDVVSGRATPQGAKVKSGLSTLLKVVIFIIGINLLVASFRPFREPICRLLLGLGLEPRSGAVLWGTGVVGVAISVIYGSWFLAKSIRKRRK